VKRILVVDDEPVIRELASLALSGSGWQVDLAGDASEALEQIERAPPDLILLDLGLPGMSGKDLARRLKARPKTAGAPIVYLTGARPDSPEPADAVLSKPFTPASLRAIAEQWLGAAAGIGAASSR
jgi:CheY-like chemotaxis protein